MGHGGWRRRGTRSVNSLDRFCQLGDFWAFWVLVAYLVIIMTRGSMLTPKRSRPGVTIALHRVMRTGPNWYQKLGPTLANNKGRNLPPALPVQPGPPQS